MRSASTGASRRDVEVTLEANPTSVEATRFRGYRAAGVNRVSLGVQALDDASLKALGRLHSAREALDAVAIARTRVRPLFVRPDLRPARPDAADVGRRTEARDFGSRRASVALPAHHRGRHAVLRPACGGQAEDAGRGGRARALRRDAGSLRAARPAGLRDFQPRARRAPNAGTIWSTGAATNMPASARARMAASTSTASGTRPRPRSVPRPG